MVKINFLMCEILIFTTLVLSKKLKGGWDCDSSSHGSSFSCSSSYNSPAKKLVCKEVDSCSDVRRPRRRHRPHWRGQHIYMTSEIPRPLPPCPPQPCPLPPCPPQQRPLPPCPLPPCPLPACPLPPCPLPPCPLPACPFPYPPCPPQPCPPFPCPPRPCPPAPCPYPDPNICNIVISILDQLLREKSIDLKFVITSKGQKFVNAVKDSMANTGLTLANQITAANTALNNTIQGLITTSNTATIAAVTNQINTANSALLSGVNSLITTADTSITTLITALAAQPAATIATIVQNLTTSAGLLQQLLAITSTLSSGIASLFATSTPAEIATITSTLNGATAQLSTQVAAAINATNNAILQQVAQALLSQTAFIVDIFNRFLNDVIYSAEAMLAEYGCEVRKIVQEALCGYRGYGASSGLKIGPSCRRPLQRPDEPYLAPPPVSVIPLAGALGSNAVTLPGGIIL